MVSAEAPVVDAREAIAGRRAPLHAPCVHRVVVGGFVVTSITMVACGGSSSHDTPDAHDTRDAIDSSAIVDAVGDTALDASDASSFDGPSRLSLTGLYADVATGALAAGVRPYVVRYPLWSDGADKQRWLFVPAGATIDTSDLDQWRFPVGTKAWKEFRVGGRRVETRFLWKNRDGEGSDAWLLVSYLWRDDGSDADAVPSGVVGLGVGATSYDVPDRDACVQCHGGIRDVLIGVSAFQLSAPDGHGDLSKLAADGLLSHPPTSEPRVPGTGVVQDALGYLHGNCGQCHNDTSMLASLRALRLRLRVADTTPESTPTYTTAIDAPMAHTWPGGPTVAIAPGNPAGSQLLFRMQTTTAYRMPPLATKVADTKAVETIRTWIASLPH